MDPAFQPDNLVLRLSSSSKTGRGEEFPFGDPNKPVYRKIGKENYDQCKSPRTPRTSRVKDDEDIEKFKIDKKMVIGAIVGALSVLLVASIIIGILFATGVIPVGHSNQSFNPASQQSNLQSTNSNSLTSVQQEQDHPNTEYMLPPSESHKIKKVHQLRN